MYLAQPPHFCQSVQDFLKKKYASKSLKYCVSHGDCASGYCVTDKVGSNNFCQGTIAANDPCNSSNFLLVAESAISFAVIVVEAI